MGSRTRRAWRAVVVTIAGTLALVPSTGGAVDATESSGVTDQLHRHVVMGGFGTPLLSVARVTRDGEKELAPGSPMPTGLASLAIAITPDARTVYSAHAGSATVVGYRIGDDGSLSPMPEATVLVGSPVIGAAITPDGSRLFVTTGPSLELGALGAAGAVLSYAISPTGGLTRTAAPAVPVTSSLSQPAVSPDGRHLVVSNYLTDDVVSFAIGAGTRLTRVGTVPAGGKPVMPAFTPDGRFVYVSNEGTGDMSGYAVGHDGVLTPSPGSPYDAGELPHGATVSSDSKRVYAPDSTGSAILGWSVGPVGELVPLPGSPYPTPGLAGRVLISPDDERLYQLQAIATDNPELHSHLHGYVLDEQGRPVDDGKEPLDTGIVFHDGTTAYFTPNQGPEARLELTARSGRSRTFSAAASSDSDGRVARYRWSFGDGSSAVTTSAEVTHTYRGSGPWQVAVTVTDDENCSTRLVFEGTTVRCRGGEQAQATITVW